MADHSARQAFTAALDTLVAQVRQDRSILAALLCGSLSHDTVWAKSDIDLVLVTIDDSKVPAGSMALYADGVNVHAFLIPRTEFRRMVEGSVQNSFMHALLAKGRLLYTHDESIARLCEGLHQLGARDQEIQLLRAATGALPAIDKAHKWLVTRGDLDYTALWILYAATSLAQIEVIGAGHGGRSRSHPAGDDAQPGPLRDHLHRLLNAKKTRPSVVAALEAVDGTSPGARRRSSRRSSTTCARPARRVRALSSRTTSRGTSTSARSRRPASTWPIRGCSARCRFAHG